MTRLPVRLILAGLVGCGFMSIAQAREWTSADGRKLEAELVSLDAQGVTLRRVVDGQTFHLSRTQLSAGDQVYLNTNPQPTADRVTSDTPVKLVSPSPKSLPPSEYAALVTGDWALGQHGQLPYALWAPRDMDASKKYPLVLALHGRSGNGENGKQVAGWMKSFTTAERQQQHPCIVLVPLGYQPYGEAGTAWNEQPGKDTLALMKELMRYLPIDRYRVYAVGSSMGGFGTCYLIDQEPTLFAGGVAVASCTDYRTADTFKKVPLWLHHAADDEVVSPERTRGLAEALKGAKNCKYTEYPTGGHGITGQVFEDDSVHAWLFGLRRR